MSVQEIARILVREKKKSLQFQKMNKCPKLWLFSQHFPFVYRIIFRTKIIFSFWEKGFVAVFGCRTGLVTYGNCFATLAMLKAS